MIIDLVLIILLSLIGLLLIIAWYLTLRTSIKDANATVPIATGGLGQTCNSTVTCASGTCDPVTQTCKSDINQSCTTGGDCASGICISTYCASSIPKSGELQGECDDSNPCTSGLICTAGTNGSLCLYPIGSDCIDNTECNSFNCTNSKCVSGTPNGYPCTPDSSCQSGTCQSNVCQSESTTACVDSTHGGYNDFITTPCPVGTTCVGNSSLSPGTCVQAKGFAEECSSIYVCSSLYQCASFGTDVSRCMFNIENPNLVSNTQTCISGFSSDVTGSGVCSGPVGSSCSSVTSCTSNNCGTGTILTQYVGLTQGSQSLSLNSSVLSTPVAGNIIWNNNGMYKVTSSSNTQSIYNIITGVTNYVNNPGFNTGTYIPAAVLDNVLFLTSSNNCNYFFANNPNSSICGFPKVGITELVGDILGGYYMIGYDGTAWYYIYFGTSSLTINPNSFSLTGSSNVNYFHYSSTDGSITDYIVSSSGSVIFVWGQTINGTNNLSSINVPQGGKINSMACYIDSDGILYAYMNITIPSSSTFNVIMSLYDVKNNIISNNIMVNLPGYTPEGTQVAVVNNVLYYLSNKGCT